MEASAPIAAATTVRAPQSGADLLGWSAVPLLADAAQPTGRWLFVGDRGRGQISVGMLGDARFFTAVGAYDAKWPLRNGVLAGVVIDGDAIARDADEGALARVLSEATRVCAHGALVFVLCRHRLLPRRLRDWPAYGGRTSERWCRAAARAGLAVADAGFANFDGERLTGIVFGGQRSRRADRVVFRVASRLDLRQSVLERMVEEAGRAVGARLDIQRTAVRRIGKTAVFLEADDGRRYILRVPRSPIAQSRAARNFTTLQALHASSIPDALKSRIPVAAARGTSGDYAYHLETCLGGREGPSGARRPGDGQWEMGAVRFVTLLHTMTAHRVTIGERELARLVRQPLSVLAAAAGPAHTGVLERLLRACESALAARTLPLVRMHGDLTESNCLFDLAGELSGVVDWEVSSDQGLPLLDLLQLMPIPQESSTHPRWQRFEAWLELWHAPERILSDPVMDGYVRAFAIPEEAVPGLVLLQWVTHVAERVDARRDDNRWMRLRLWQPLESLGRALRD